MLIAQIFAAATVLADLVLIGFLAAWLIEYSGLKSFGRDRLKKIGEYRLELLFLVALGGSVGSLALEYFAGWQPCTLCWYQRIFLYPQVFLAGTALFLEKEDLADYLVPLNLFGGSIAVYHYMIQMIEKLSFGCAGLVECSDVYATYFGYVTIPMMSLTVFAMMILLSLIPED